MKKIFTRERAEIRCRYYELQGFTVRRLLYRVVTSRRQVDGLDINAAVYAYIFNRRGHLFLVVTHEWIDEKNVIW